MNGNRITTTHVGSIIRPPRLVEFLKLTENGADYDSDAFNACLQEFCCRCTSQRGLPELFSDPLRLKKSAIHYTRRRIQGTRIDRAMVLTQAISPSRICERRQYQTFLFARGRSAMSASHSSSATSPISKLRSAR